MRRRWRRRLEDVESEEQAPEMRLEESEEQAPEVRLEESEEQAPEVRLEESVVPEAQLVGEFMYGLQQVLVAPLLLLEAQGLLLLQQGLLLLQQGLDCWDHSSSSRRWKGTKAS